MVIATDWVRLLVVCVLFTAAAGAVLRWGGLASPGPVVKAALRATAQLAAVSAVITAVLASLPLTTGFLLLMAGVATGTSAARTKTGRKGVWVGLAILVGTVPAIAALVLTGLVPLNGIALVPVGGILIGGAMTATTLSVRRALDTLHDRHGEYEAALALGFTEPVAVRELIRRPAAEALLPALDQTRTVGLVTLPGAFVGMLLGGAPVWQAGALQLVVLLGLLAVETAAIATVVELVARGLVRRTSQATEVRLA
ncbi:putative ABC transport system permease protein [Saccharothrix tamanrassetensis]|uniref:Putative ABC transport system permease protein n=1 Tax=Saccharothrix tamanrassetensis TaxID=1051531 RepID=A0A841CKJ8_9PSEU|nr:ABC transporter permease [Saccharothrix tamanrassetensis]MBB5956515.1 putative ABC transport system permease protein [Saccharothrix tamanrassetensis]